MRLWTSLARSTRRHLSANPFWRTSPLIHGPRRCSQTDIHCSSPRRSRFLYPPCMATHHRTPSGSPDSATPALAHPLILKSQELNIAELGFLFDRNEPERPVSIADVGTKGRSHGLGARGAARDWGCRSHCCSPLTVCCRRLVGVIGAVVPARPRARFLSIDFPERVARVPHSARAVVPRVDPPPLVYIMLSICSSCRFYRSYFGLQLERHGFATAGTCSPCLRRAQTLRTPWEPAHACV